MIRDVERRGRFQKWTEDVQVLVVSSAASGEARMLRVEVTTGKRTLLQKIELTEKAGSTVASCTPGQQTCVYSTRRIIGMWSWAGVDHIPMSVLIRSWETPV